MTNAYFHHLSDATGWATYRADDATAGPWAPNLQHGGPPNALMVHAAESHARSQTGRDDLIGLRLAAEFVGPVPVGEVAVRADVVRTARAGVLVDTVLTAGGRECLHGRIWLIRDADTTELAQEPAPVPEPSPTLPDMGAGFPYGDSIEWRIVHGGLRIPGPGTAWARPRMPVVASHRLTGLQRAALIGDSASGLSSALDWTVFSFLNVDLDVHLARPMRGEWLLMEAATQLGPRGSALARSILSDIDGPLGSTAQTLVVEPIRPSR